MGGMLWVCVAYFAVSLLVILGAARLCGSPTAFLRSLLGALLGAVYSGLCLLPQLGCLGSPAVRVLCLILCGLVVFGLGRQSVRPVVVYTVLNLSVEGCALALGGAELKGLLPSALLIFGLCLFGGRQSEQTTRLTLACGDKICQVQALLDTGNRLLDPVTGQQVLVVGPRAARELVGLSEDQLSDPLNTLLHCSVKGLRLIPYRSVGVGAGFLLAMQLSQLVGKKRRPVMVGFAARGLEENGVDALLGVAV